MNVRSIGMVNGYKKTNFTGGEKSSSNYENPISRKTEKNLAILTNIGGCAVVGAVIGGLSTFIPKVNNKIALLVGLAAGVVSAAFTLPSKIYNTKVSVFAKEKEMDVFSRDKALKTNLTEEVHKEVLDPEVSLDKKLDDNLKLQTANRGSSLFIQH